MLRCILTFLLTTLLAACTVPAVGSQAVSRVSPPLEPVGTYSLEGDPNFSPEKLPREMRLWHSRLWEGINEINDSDKLLNPNDLAATGDLYRLGRFLNVYLTSLMTSLRVTGDLALLDEIDRVMSIAQSEIADYNADGYRNWRWLNRRSDNHYNDDYHHMDEMLAHSLVAAVAYAFKANEAFDARYAEQAAFWTDYLKNDFEAKWRDRNDVRTGFPFLGKELTHPYVQFIRYHHYMYKLTGELGYHREALRMGEQVAEFVREVYTPGGPAYVWDHRFTQEYDFDAIGCQPFIYLQYTFQAFQDLALEGLPPFSDDGFMQRVATSMTELIINDGYRTFAKDICGGRFQRGLFPTTGDPGVTSLFANYPYGVLGKWDATGEIKDVALDIYENTDWANKEANLSAIMLLLLADNPDGEQASERLKPTNLAATGE